MAADTIQESPQTQPGASTQSAGGVKIGGYFKNGTQFSRLLINGRQISGGEKKVRAIADASVDIFGLGKDFKDYDSVVLRIGGEPYTPLDLNILSNVISFRLRNYDQLLPNGGLIEIELKSFFKPQFNSELFYRLSYNSQPEEEDEEEKEAGQQEEQESDSRESVAEDTGSSAQAATTATQAKTLQTKRQQNKPEQEKQLDSDDAGQTPSEESEIKAVLPENAKQSFEMVGEYIDKNPTIIVDNDIRTEVLSGLRAGSLANLSQEARVALGGAMSTQTLGSAQLRQAMQITSRQMGEVSRQATATNQTSTTQNVTTAVQGSQTVSGQVSAEAVSSSTSGASIQTQGNIRTNLEIVGEHLDKNSGLIANNRVRTEILRAAASGNIGGLSAEARVALQSTLKALSTESGGIPNRVSSAAQQLQVSLSAPQMPADESVVSSPQLRQPVGVQSAGSVAEPVGQKTDSSGQAATTTNLAPQKPSAGASGLSVGQGQQAQSGQAGSTVQNRPSGTSAAPIQKENLKAADEMAKGAVSGAKKPPSNQAEANAQQTASLDEKEKGAESDEGQDQAQKKSDQEQALPGKGVVDGIGGKAPVGMGKMAGNDASLSTQLGNVNNRPKNLQEGEIGPAPASSAPLGSLLPVKPNNQAGQGEIGPGGAQGMPATPPGVNPPQTPTLAQAEDKPKDDESDQEENDQAPIGPMPPVANNLPEALEKIIEEAVTPINLFINGDLQAWAWAAWLAGVPTFGLTILLGAIIGTLLWIVKLIKKPLVRFALNRVRPPGVKPEMIDEITEKLVEKIDLSMVIKAQIIAMDIIVVVVGIFALIFLVSSILWICNSYSAQFGALVSGLRQQYNAACTAVNNVGSQQ